MKRVLENASLELVRVLGAALLVLIPGILNAPDLKTALAFSVAALPAFIAAGIKVLQNVVPSLSFAEFLPQPLAAWVDAFVRAALGVFFTFWLGWLAAPDWATWKSALLAALIGAVSAGVRALQGFLTKGEFPAKSVGLPA